MRIIMLTDIAKYFVRRSVKDEDKALYTPEYIIWMCDNLGKHNPWFAHRKPPFVWKRKTPNEAYLSWRGCQELIRRNWYNSDQQKLVEDRMWMYTKEKE